MNQASELSAFIDWLEINPLEPTTQTLWIHLMVMANKSGCPEWFTVGNPLLMAKVGVTENTLIKHRNYLVQKGRIEYKSMGKQKAGKYRFIPLLTSINEVNHEVKRAANYEVNREVKGDALLKDLSSSSTSSTHVKPYESFFAAHKRVYGFDMNPFQSRSLVVYIDEDQVEEGVIVRAIERAALVSGPYNFKLVLRIVDDYFKAGAKTLAEAEQFDALFDGKRSAPETSSGAGTKQTSKSGDYAQIARELEHEEARSG